MSADLVERLRAVNAEMQEAIEQAEAELDRLRDEIERLRATVNRVIEDLEMAVFCDGHTRAMPCEPECHCVQHYDAVRGLIR
jgi:hypothetical protein